MFYHRTLKRPTEPADHGTREKNIYSIETTITGHKKVVVAGKTNTYDKIQEHAESTKIENIVKRYKNGDINALNVRESVFADVVDAPKSFTEAQILINKMEKEFNHLPLEIRKQYGFDAERLIADYGSENYMKVMGLNKEEVSKHEEIPKVN